MQPQRTKYSEFRNLNQLGREFMSAEYDKNNVIFQSRLFRI